MLGRVYIISSGDDPLDEEFARLLAKDIEHFALPKLIPANDFVEYSADWFQRGTGYPGISIFILSHSIASTTERRNALTHSVRFKDSSLYHHYYICRGISAITLRKNHPDLSSIYEAVTVVDEKDYPELLADLKQYTSHELSAIHENVTPFVTIKNITRIVLSTTLATAMRLMFLIYALSHLGALALGILLILASHTIWIPILTLGCMYGAGFRINRITPLDLWPWLGPRWILPKSVATQVLETGLERRGRFGAAEFIALGIGSGFAQALGSIIPIAIGLAFGKITQTAIDQWYKEKGKRLAERIQQDERSLTAAAAPGAICSENCLREAFSNCYSFGSISLRNSVVWLVVFLLPGLVSLISISSLSYYWAACAFAVGMVTPAVSAWSHRTYEYSLVRLRGMTDKYLEDREKLTQRLDIKPLPFLSCVDENDLAHFDEVERGTITRWITLAAFPSSPFTPLWWQTLSDYVFISYAWADDSETKMSSQLASVFDGLNINYFLDKRALDSKFRAWRPALAEGIWKSTHLFLVVSPNIANGDVIKKELSTAFYRWYFELMPAIICVVEPEVAKRLREDKRVPLNLRFVLTWCPQLTFSQARNPQLVEFILNQRRRQGILKDWRTVLALRMSKLKVIENYVGFKTPIN